MNTQLDNAPTLIGVPLDDVARFDRVEPECHFAIPAHPTIKKQLIYYSALSETLGDPIHLRMWACAQKLITEWECAALPDRGIDLDSGIDPDAAMVIMWAGNVVLDYMQNLKSLPKVLSEP